MINYHAFVESFSGCHSWNFQAPGRIEKVAPSFVVKLWVPVVKFFEGLLEGRNPFYSIEDDRSPLITTFEVQWNDVVGLDYRCPLIDDGRIVLEARCLSKRNFHRVRIIREGPFFVSSAVISGGGGALSECIDISTTACVLYFHFMVMNSERPAFAVMS